jgi:O-Antigen ligase
MEKITIFFGRNNNLKTYLFLANIFLVVFAIVCFNLGVLPFNHIGDFGFLIFIVFLFALYRPGWAFLFFIGSIILETINLSPEGVGIMLRPYQILGALGMLAIIIRFFSKRLNFDVPKFFWYDWVLIVFSLSGFVSALVADNKSVALKQSLVILSFLGLYFFSRVFIQNLKDIKRVLPFFLGSAAIIIVYSIWQNCRFLNNKNHFEVMPGRPNGTFAEADWLGIFLVFLISVLYAIAYNFYRKISFEEIKYNINEVVQASLIWIMITLSYVALILTVARSAWLGAGIVLIIFVAYILKSKNYSLIGLTFGSILVSIGIVYIFGLTNFELGNRIQSTGSGKQEITVSCDKDSNIPRSIKNISELEKFNCVHINLEDIEKETSLGRVITRAYRDDPNVSIRSEIYKKSWEEIKKHPIVGIGWGNIGQILGSDERGESLNSSNIFLEVWLGSGLLGIIAFVLVLGNIFYRGVRNVFQNKEDIFGIFISLSFFAIIIPNLFNAGIMLGFLWVWLAVAQIEE